jgi:hypothetical protein
MLRFSFFLLKGTVDDIREQEGKKENPLGIH